MEQHTIGKEHLTVDRLGQIEHKRMSLALSDKAREVIAKCRTYLDTKLEKDIGPIYGVNTGFGALCHVMISLEQAEELQANLVRSHACGIGEEVPEEIVRLMLVLKLQSLSYGHSGVSVKTVERLIEFFNLGILPVIFEQGSLGASGDLCPLAHLSLPLIGEGEVRYMGQRRPTADVLKELGMEPLKLESKEGLAMLNGTQFMSAYGVHCLLEGERLSRLSDLVAALAMDARLCMTEPLNALIHNLRRHPGQAATAARILEILRESEIAAEPKTQVQDSYSFRCTPQVHGASKDAIAYVRSVLSNEINAVTDNPNIFVDEDLILSGGNFHGQPLALAFDFMAMALSELANIAERRTYRLLAGERDLPPFLIEDSGLNSGLMIPQYSAAALVSQNKQLCTPASVDSIPSCNEQEDHVSMGANAATKLLRVVQNTEHVLAIEFMTAAQALEFRRPLRTSPMLEQIMEDYREVVPKLESDRFMHADILKTVEFLRKI